MTDPTGQVESAELQQLSVELRRLETEQRRLELDRARHLDAVERRHREEQTRALQLDNDAKERDLDWKRSGVFWTRIGLLVAWIVTLAPVWITVNEYWDEREEAAQEELRVAAAERKVSLQDAMRRFNESQTTAAFELPNEPEGVSFLVSQLQWGPDGPETDQEIEKARAALIALGSAAVELTPDHAEVLRQEREQLLERLEKLGRRWREGVDDVGEQESYLAQYEIHRRLRRLLRDEDDGWSEPVNPDDPSSTVTRGDEIERTRADIEGSVQG